MLLINSYKGVVVFSFHTEHYGSYIWQMQNTVVSPASHSGQDLLDYPTDYFNYPYLLLNIKYIDFPYFNYITSMAKNAFLCVWQTEYIKL